VAHGARVRVPADGARVFVVEVCAGLDEKLEHTLATAEHSTYEHRPPAYGMAGATQSATSRDPTCEHRHLGTNVHGMWIASGSRANLGQALVRAPYSTQCDIVGIAWGAWSHPMVSDAETLAPAAIRTSTARWCPLSTANISAVPPFGSSTE
jgi:hypothetical protein